LKTTHGGSGLGEKSEYRLWGRGLKLLKKRYMIFERSPVLFMYAHTAAKLYILNYVWRPHYFARRPQVTVRPQVVHRCSTHTQYRCRVITGWGV